MYNNDNHIIITIIYNNNNNCKTLDVLIMVTFMLNNLHMNKFDDHIKIIINIIEHNRKNSNTNVMNYTLNNQLENLI